MYKRILAANDGSEGAARALQAALRLAHAFGTELHMISVEEMPNIPTTIDEVVEEEQEAHKRFGQVIARAKTEAKTQGVKLTAHIVKGHAVPAIVRFIEGGKYDLLVIGYMGHSALYNRLIGSTTDRLVELAPCAVLVVK